MAYKGSNFNSYNSLGAHDFYFFMQLLYWFFFVDGMNWRVIKILRMFIMFYTSEEYVFHGFNGIILFIIVDISNWHIHILGVRF